MRLHPGAYELLLGGEINLDTLSKVSKLVTGENAGSLIAAIRGRSSREVELELSRYGAREGPRDRARALYVRSGGSGGKFTAGAGGKNVTTAQGLFAALERACGPARPVEVRRTFTLEFTVEPAFMEKIELIRALLSTKHRKKLDLESLFNILRDEYLDRHGPEGRTKRREKAQKNKKPRANAKRSRHIPQAVRDAVYVRDGGRCTFRGTDGKRCTKNVNLEVDHIIPYARGGGNTPDNLRLLCARHNRHAAEIAYGKEHMRQYRQRE